LTAETAVGRGIIRDANEQARGHDLYPERSHIAETPFAHAEHNLAEGTNDTPQVFAPGTWSNAAIAVSASVTVILGYRPVAAARFASQAAQSQRDYVARLLLWCRDSLISHRSGDITQYTWS
jgi:hypothetical protein